MIRRATKTATVVVLILAWFAGAWCFCTVAAPAADGRAPVAAHCPLCLTPAGHPRPTTAGGWCPVLVPAIPDRPAPPLERPVAVAVLPAPAAGVAVVRVSNPATAGPQCRPPPRSLFDLYCSILG